MIDEVGNLIKNFPGEGMCVWCFAHVLNLIVKSILKQFDLLEAKKDEILSEGLEELRTLRADLELEEQISRKTTNNNNDDVGDIDGIEGWIDKHQEMSEDELEELEDTILPVQRVLVKVRVNCLFI